LAHIPRTSNGKMRIDEFINLPILSEEAFNAIDRNKDGFLTMGEIKLVNKNATKSEIKETIQEYDFDKDGKLNTAEYHQVGRGTQKCMFIFFLLLPQVMEQVGMKYLVGGYNFNR